MSRELKSNPNLPIVMCIDMKPFEKTLDRLLPGYKTTFVSSVSNLPSMAKGLSATAIVVCWLKNNHNKTQIRTLREALPSIPILIVASPGCGAAIAIAIEYKCSYIFAAADIGQACMEANFADMLGEAAQLLK